MEPGVTTPAGPARPGLAAPPPSAGAQLREMALVAGPAVALVLAAFWLAFQFVEPAPPKTVVISTGGEAGAYYRFGKRYAELLAGSGIKLVVRPSAGSGENLKRLSDPAEGVQLALIQGGVSDRSKQPDVVSLGRVFLEPLWIFHRLPGKVERLSELAGKRIAVGPQGSGTRVLAEQLLAANAIGEAEASLLPLGGQSAVDALLQDKADAIFLTLAPEAPLVQTLLQSTDVGLVNLAQAEAYTRRLPFLSRVVLPQGVADLVAMRPSEDIVMVAAQAAVVARADLHPAVVALMVDVLKEVHSGGGMFQRIGEFPRPQEPEYAFSEHAERTYTSGQPFFQRFLPFWLANFIERMVVMLLPFATIFLPLLKIVPMVYEWRIKSRLLYWYGHLKTLEKELAKDRTAERLPAYKAEIDLIDEAVSMIPVPLHYSDRHYELRAAIDLVRQRIAARTQPVAG